MKQWHFTLPQKPEQVIEKLETGISSINGITISCNKKNDPIEFYFRKRLLDGEKIFYYNNVIVKGKISKTDKENESRLEILFKENSFVTITKLILYGLAIITIIVAILNHISMFIPGIILIVLVSSIGLWLNKKFNTFVSEYQSLISDFFKIE